MTDSVWETVFIVTDVETTGSSAEKNRITDVACVIVQGGEIIRQFSALVNPHQFIPPFIAKMTGISQAMVAAAPDPEDVFPEVSDIVSDPRAIFVAHNAGFDFGFINSTLERCNLPEIEIPTLCTLKLARRLIDGKTKKNVGSLADHFGIKVKNRHRALGDALATAEILIEFMDMAEKDHSITTIDELLHFQNKPIKHFKAPTPVYKRVESSLEQLPYDPGVYKFYDKQGKILYVGKAKCLHNRVRSYFQPESFTSRKIANMTKKIYSVDWECTATELGALLLESAEIKKHKPYYNTVDKKYQKYYFIKFLNNVEFPRIELTDKIEKDNAEYFGPFRSPYAVNEIIQTIDNKFKLRKCEGKLKPSAENKPCFYHHIDRCFAPCSLQITEKEYQKEVKKAEFFLTGNDEGMISHFTDEMLALSEDLKFEEAANMRNRIAELRKLFDRKQDVPASINNNNFAMVLPASDQSKTVEIFLIKSGKLVFQEQVGRKAPLTEAHRTIRSEFFSRRKPGALSLSDQDIDKLRIITAWTFRHKSTGSFVYSNGMTANDFIFEFDKAVRNTVFESEDVE